MSGIPDEPACSICEHCRTRPPQRELKVLTEVQIAWCALYERRLFAPGNEASISFTVCSKFKSVYWSENSQRSWPLAPLADEDHLWLNRPSNAPPYWIHRPFIRLDQLPKVDSATGDEVAKP